MALLLNAVVSVLMAYGACRDRKAFVVPWLCFYQNFLLSLVYAVVIYPDSNNIALLLSACVPWLLVLVYATENTSCCQSGHQEKPAAV